MRQQNNKYTIRQFFHKTQGQKEEKTVFPPAKKHIIS